MKSKKEIKKSFRPHHIYHLTVKGKKTTISLRYYLSELLCLKLNLNERSREAHGVVRKWLQDKISNPNAPFLHDVNSWLLKQVVFELIDKELSKKYYQTMLDD